MILQTDKEVYGAPAGTRTIYFPQQSQTLIIKGFKFGAALGKADIGVLCGFY